MGCTDVVLGVGVGTEVVTVAVIGSNLKVCEIVEWSLPGATPYSAGPGLNPWSVLDTVCSAVREAIGICEVFGNRVQGLSLSVGSPSLLALDALGQPLTSVVDYGDGRSIDVARRIVAEYGDELHELTGVPVNPASPVVKLAWVAANDPELGGQAVRWTGLKGFLLSQLTGVLASDVSTWSARGMVETDSLDWAQPALDLARVRRGQLPDLVDPASPLRLTAVAAEQLGLRAGTPVIVGASSAATALLGAGAALADCAALSMGASASLSVLCSGPVTARSELVSCHALTDGLWVARGVFSNGEAVARWAAKSFGGVDIDVLLDEAERVPLGAQGLIGIPHQTTDSAPWWDPDFRAAFVGLRAEHGRAAMTRAMAEGVARQLAMVSDSLVSVTRPISRVRAYGRSLRSPLWGSLLAAALDVPVEILGTGDAAAFGSALMAWRGLGLIERLGALPEVRLPAREVLPDPLATAHFAATRQLGEELSRMLTQLRLVS